MKGAYVARLLGRAFKTSQFSLHSNSGLFLFVLPVQPHVVVLLGEAHGSALVLGVPSLGFHGYGVMEGEARTSARRHFWLWVMGRRQQPNNEERAPVMVMELGELSLCFSLSVLNAVVMENLKIHS